MRSSLDHEAALAAVDDLATRARDGDATAELDLVRRRYELGRELMTSPVERSTAWRDRSPASLDDPFPSLVGLPPEIDHADLDPGLFRAAVVHHGCLVVHDFFPPDTVARLRGDIDALIDGFDVWMASEQRSTAPPWYAPLDAPGAERPLAIRGPGRHIGTFYAPDSPRGMRHLIDAYDAAGMPDFLRAYQGEPSLLALERTALRRVPSGVPMAWHQDGYKFGTEAGPVNAWVSLCNAGTEAPTLGVVPTRITEILPLNVGSSVPWEIEPGALADAAAAGGATTMELELGPGDAVLFDEMLAHATISHTHLTELRYGADAWFFPASSFPRDHVPFVYAA